MNVNRRRESVAYATSVFVGSHCLVEWDEPGNPRNVVLRKTVAGANGVDSDDSIAVGSLCYVDVRSGSKKARYQATLLGIGKD